MQHRYLSCCIKKKKKTSGYWSIKTSGYWSIKTSGYWSIGYRPIATCFSFLSFSFFFFFLFFYLFIFFLPGRWGGGGLEGWRRGLPYDKNPKDIFSYLRSHN